MFAPYVRQTARRSDAASDAYRKDGPGDAHRLMVVVTITSALALTLTNFLAKDPTRVPGFLASFAVNSEPISRRLSSAEMGQLARLTVWTVVQLFAYVGLPVLAIKMTLRKRIGDFGVSWSGVSAHWKPYVLLSAISVPIVM